MHKNLSIKNISKLPKKPGVYFLKNKKGDIFYIGKANNIRSRVQNHKNNPQSYKPEQIYSVEYLVGANEIEALIKESEYIKKYNPRMNIRLRDDKKYFYVGITSEELPRIFITHQPSTNAKIKNQIAKGKNIKIEYLGPYTDGNALKQTMKYLRRIFPYYTTSPKRPLGSARHKSLPCSWCHLELCPGPNPNKIECKKNIRRIKDILIGGQKSVVSSLKKEMKMHAGKQEYEKAGQLKTTIEALENIFLHHTPPVHKRLDTDYLQVSQYLSKLLNSDLSIKSIEGYDISNIQGREPTASMVRFDNGSPNKDLYRKFNIQSKNTPDDYLMMQEVIKRRFSRKDWPFPDMILIDGGRGQLNAALKILNGLDISVQAASLAKREEELYLPGKKPKHLSNMPSDVENLLKHIRDEAHRFALSHHRKKHMEGFKK